MELSNNKILITGGATGIGLGLTERFLKEHNTVIICGRREAALQAVADKHPAVITRVCDLSVEADRIGLYNWIQQEHPDLTVLVNNAGIQQWMDITDDDFYSRAEAEVITNILAPIHLTSLLVKLPALKTVINVTSGLSFSPLAKVPVYSATKAFFHSFTLSLRHLLKARHIEVIEMIPPALNTDLGGVGLHTTAPPVSGFVDSVFEQMAAGKTMLTYGTSEARANASAAAFQQWFDQMNPS